MWKIAVGFIIFAALAMYVVVKGGDKLSLAGEQHGTEAHGPADAASAPAAAASASR
jgi:hypothetical protein